MKEELFKKLLDWANSLENLANEQLPPLLKEVSNYGIFWTVVGIVIFIGFGFFGAIIARNGYKTYKENFYTAYISTPGEGVVTFGIILMAVGFVVGLLIIGCNAKAWLAPRMFFIHMLKG